MNEERHIHETIDLYLRGELIGEDLDLFKIKLREDSSFALQVQLQKAIIEEIQVVREAELRKIFAKKNSNRKGLIIPFNRKVLSVAAVILSITAIAMVLKMYLPKMDIAGSKNEDPAVVDNSVDSSDDEESFENAEALIDSLEEVKENLIASTETEETKDTDAARPSPSSSVMSEDAESDPLTDMRKKEELLNAKDINARKDELITTRDLMVMVYTMKMVEKVPADDTTLQAVSSSSLTKKERKKLAQVADKASNADEVISAPAEPQIVQTPGSTIIIEYWRNVLNFRGYYYDGKKLKLYDVPPDARLQMVNYLGKTYLKWAGSVYLINNSSTEEKFKLVTDVKILEVVGK
ncbi:MAG: hypothetical protein GC181_08760 [Bacteroidetes bacterium]|nr:hypothetical protein [Bacteroidota bacterium]